MTQENQNQGVSLEERLLELGTFSQIHSKLNKARNYDNDELSQEYVRLANMLGKRNNTDPKEFYGNIKVSPVEATKIAREAVDKAEEDIKPLYEQNKEKITRQVVSLMRERIKDVKNKWEAASILGKYLKGLIEIPELDQNTADEYAAKDLEAKSGISMLFGIRGDINKYKGIHEANTLAQRVFASEYLKDVKDSKGNVTGYDINESKVAEIMSEPRYGAMIYTNILIEVAKQAQKQKEAETQKKAS